MVLIHGTNVLVDDFKSNRPNRKSFVYFLTHFHYEYYKGLDDTWTNERIYCSDITRSLLIRKYPNLKNVIALEESQREIIFLDIKKTIYIEVTAYDANHCFGSLMILFNGYMGTILHTGDFRWSSRFIKETKSLFPPSKQNAESHACSIHIDEVIFDDTYCDPTFRFPARKEALNAVKKIITEKREVDETQIFCLAADSIGKEELFAHLATGFKTQILVDETKYDLLQTAGYYLDNFTTDPADTFIHLISKSQIRTKLLEEAVVFIPTGLCNETCLELEPNCYMVGYSIHCNFQDLQNFLKAISPAIITPQSKHFYDRVPLEKLEKSQLNKWQKFKYMKKNGLSQLAKYCDHRKLSSSYKDLLKREYLAALQKELGLDTVIESRASYAVKLRRKEIARQKAKAGANDNNKNGKRADQRRKISDENGDEDEEDEDEEVLDAIEIDEGGFEDDEEEEDEDDDDVIRDETWKDYYSQDVKKFEDKYAPTEEERKTILKLEKDQTEFPFSDTSERERLESDSEDEEELVGEGIDIEEAEEIVRTKPTAPIKLYSGELTLTITLKQTGQSTALNENFVMYTEGKPVKEIHIPNDMNFQTCVPFSEVEPLMNQINNEEDDDEGHHDKYGRVVIQTGWIEGERKGSDSLFVKLSEHMKKHNIARQYKIKDKTIIYFMHPHQIDLNLDSAPMVFIIASIGNL